MIYLVTSRKQYKMKVAGDFLPLGWGSLMIGEVFILHYTWITGCNKSNFRFLSLITTFHPHACYLQDGTS